MTKLYSLVFKLYAKITEEKKKSEKGATFLFLLSTGTVHCSTVISRGLTSF